MDPKKLIRQLLAKAEASGIKEGQLAERAGLTPQGLSKAKSRGDLRVSTLEALGRELGLELSWRPVRQSDEVTRRVRAGNLFQFGDKTQDQD